jgi:hypothetical protein
MMKEFVGPGGVLRYAKKLSFPGGQARVVIVRCWNKDATAMKAFMEHWEKIREKFFFRTIILVIDADRETGTTTLDALKACGDPPWITPIFVSGPATVRNWTRLLNGALKYLHICGATQGLVCVASFEAGFDSPLDSLLKLDEHHAVPIIGIRRSKPDGCTPMLAQFIDDLSAIPQQTIGGVLRQEEALFAGPPPTEIGEWAQQTLFFCRDTYQFWSYEWLLRMKGFDPRCNDWGGQEDTALRIRLGLNDCFLPTDRVFYYTDTRVVAGALTHLGETQMEKVLREVQAAHSIYRQYYTEYHAWNRQGDFVIPVVDFDW